MLRDRNQQKSHPVVNHSTIEIIFRNNDDILKPNQTRNYNVFEVPVQKLSGKRQGTVPSS